MKSILTLAATALLAIHSYAQAPEKFSYQAVLRDGNNNLIQEKVIGMRVDIRQGTTNGTIVYAETHITKTNLNGLASIEIGTGSTVSGTFSGINWGQGPYFIQTQTDPDGGTQYVINSVSQLMSVPYAFFAKTAAGVRNAHFFSHYIGESFGGGVIFHLWKDSLGQEHGLIAHPHEFTSVKWSNIVNAPTGALSSWDGYNNSLTIKAQNNHVSSAASMCLGIDTAGFNDWYLPALDALTLLWTNRYVVNQTLSQTGGTPLSYLQDVSYWTSTERSVSEAWRFLMANGSASNSNKNNGYIVRAIRSF
jgi:hypothetical protein